jgi:hypothetical protein
MRLRFNISDRPFELTLHALQRYCERVRGITDPQLSDLNRACAEVKYILQNNAGVSVGMPDWLEQAESDEVRARQATHYLVIGQDVAFPLKRKGDGTWVLVSCLARGTMSSEQRRRRNDRRKKRAMVRRERRAMKSWLGERNDLWH